MKNVEFEHLFVVTGGPRSGKSTLVDAMAGRGISSMPEGGRAINQDQSAIAGEDLLWSDR
jgi:predicted ATPase